MLIADIHVGHHGVVTRARARRAPDEASLAVVVDSWVSSLTSPNTATAYRSDMTRYAEWCARRGVGPLEVGPHDIDAFRVDSERSGMAAATVARRLSAVASFFRHAVDVEAVTANPVERSERPPRTTRSETGQLDEGQAHAVLEAAAGSARSSALVGLLLLDGLKLGEALALDVEDLEQRHTVAAVARRHQTQTIRLHVDTTAAIDQYLARRRSGPLFLSDSPTRDGRRLTRFGADFLLKQTGVDAGIDWPISANTLRRTYMTIAVSRGDSLAAIQRHVGHADRRTTRRLASMPDSDQR
jgi:integrase/recombinase XerD